MNEELAYSIHLGSDKNRTNKAKEIAKSNHLEQHHFQIMLFKMQNNYQMQINTI